MKLKVLSTNIIKFSGCTLFIAAPTSLRVAPVALSRETARAHWQLFASAVSYSVTLA
jgi:hypothetical protein